MPRNPGRTARVAILASVAGVLLVGVLDYASGAELAFSVFYVLPVIATAWYGSGRAALTVTILAAFTWRLAEFAAEVHYPSTFVAVWNPVMRFVGFAIVAHLVLSLRQQLFLAQHRARTDPLTGVISRGRFMELLEGELARARRFGHPVSLAFLDVDDFKQVNDRHGHLAGDRLLKALAQAIQDHTRAIDVTGRVGGDEFMLLMPGTDADDAAALVERLHPKLGEAASAAGHACTLSLGVVTFLTPVDSSEEAMAYVDEVMYEAKREGKAGVRQRTVGGE